MGARSGSKISMIAGVMSGICVSAGLWMSQTDRKLGFGLVTALTILLCVLFLIRLIKTKKFVPSGLLLILSAMAGVLAFLSYLGKTL